MRLLLDEMLSPQIARTLHERRHDVVAIQERREWVSSDDDRVMVLAREEHRAVVTSNVRDFRPRAATAALPGGPGHYGVVFLPVTYRRTRADIGRLAAALEEELAAHPGERDLESQEAWLG